MSFIFRSTFSVYFKTEMCHGCKCKSENEYVDVNVSSDTICGIITHVLSHQLSGSCDHDVFLCLANLQNCSLLVDVFSISIPVEAILYNWSDPEWQRSMLAPDKLNTISFIHDNYTYLLNSDSE